MKNNGLAIFFAGRVSSGAKLWTEVPITWKEATINELIKKGYTLNDDGTVIKEEDTE